MPPSTPGRKPRTPTPTDQDLRRRAQQWLERLLIHGEAASSADQPEAAGQHGGRDRGQHDAVT